MSLNSDQLDYMYGLKSLLTFMKTVIFKYIKQDLKNKKNQKI